MNFTIQSLYKAYLNNAIAATIKTAVFVFLLTTGSVALAQEAYFQQEANYNIAVRLDDENHLLHGFETITYTNHSKDSLSFLYFHLWPNAYRERNTAFNRQKIRLGSQRFHFADSSQRGFIDSLAFRIDGQPVSLVAEAENPDVVKLILADPIESGEQVTITTPFRVKIPASFSRLGHVKQQYQITQWYPKLAVYDQQGWHLLPYLDMGEFYSDFGSYDVSITLPANYVVGATGQLQNLQEQVFLDSLAAVTTELTDYPTATADTFPPSSLATKTLRYVQDSVIDFAWFADKRYAVQQGELTLPHSGRTVKLLALYNHSNGKVWKDVIEYMRDGIYYYSERIGDYPYEVVTVVDGALSAGSGMEYPTITVLGANTPFILENVVVHEIGHNWFQGILASNERAHPWMDEGLNSYYELSYFTHKYPKIGIMGLNPDTVSTLGERLARYAGVSTTPHGELYNLAYRYLASFHEDQPNETVSDEFTNETQYGIISYQKTAALLDYLYYYLGEDLFDRTMQAYFERWKFKHPAPEDLRAVLEEVSGKNLDWLFKDFLQTSQKMDYKISRVKPTDNGYEITIKNVGDINGPVQLTLFKDSTQVFDQWYEPIEDSKKVSVSVKDIDYAQLFPNRRIPDINFSNNRKNVSGLGVKPIRLKLGGALDDPNKSTIYWLPTLGANTRDKFMLGAIFYSSLLPNRRFQFELNPMYSFGRNEHAGRYDLSYRWYPSGAFSTLEVGGVFKDFAGLQKLAPRLVVDFRSKNPAQAPRQQLMLEYNVMRADQDLLSQYERSYQIGRLAYELRNDNALMGYGLQTQLSTDYRSFSLAEVRATYARAYRRGRNAQVSAYVGTFLQEENISPIYALNFSGSPDYTFDDVFLDRAQISDNYRALVEQTNLQQGGMRGFIDVTSRTGLATLKADADLPFAKFIQVFYDQGLDFQDGAYYYSAGLSLNLASIVCVYFPVAGDSFTSTTPESWRDFTNSIQFAIRFDRLNPKTLIKNSIR